MKGKHLHPKSLYPAKLSFRMEGQIKCFLAKVKLKEFIVGNYAMRGKCGSAPHLEKPVGREVGKQDPRPRTGSPMGNQACIVPRLL